MSDATIIREAVQPLTGSAQDYDSLLALIGDARFVLLGEASHGTHEFYAERAAITKRLIAERGFTVVAIEAATFCRGGESAVSAGWSSRQLLIDRKQAVAQARSELSPASLVSR